MLWTVEMIQGGRTSSDVAILEFRPGDGDGYGGVDFSLFWGLNKKRLLRNGFWVYCGR